ncbi:MAG: DAK2 domain-containing protein, partial [Desulfotomaculales bacterium]
MSVVFLTGPQFHEILTAGAARLARKCQEIDALNVFPVPDGDTGTNMYLTLVAALDVMGQTAEKTIGALVAACARGAIAGARGNSGVILSQLLQGFAVALAGKERATAEDLAEGFNKGVELAYQAVTEPVEGTILTMARCAAEAVRSYRQKSCDLRRFGIYLYRRSLETLAATPDLLPVLKAAGVVDAGGKGFVTILEGII